MVNVFKMDDIIGEARQVCLIVGTPHNECVLGFPAFKNRTLVFDQEEEKIGFLSGEKPSIEPDKDRNNNSSKPDKAKEIIDKKASSTSTYVLVISIIIIIISCMAILSVLRVKYRNRGMVILTNSMQRDR